MQPRRPLVATAALWAAAALAAATSAGCRNEMYDQPKYEAQEANSYFVDGASSRPLVDGTVPRLLPTGEPRDRLFPDGLTSIDRLYRTGRKADGSLTDELPPAVLDGGKLSKADLLRGQQRYRIYCMPCHSVVGDGRGLIVERGFSPPPSFYDPVIKAKPLGHYYDVITNGHGAMYSYAARIGPRDRWLIASYIRVLQLSRDVPADHLSGEDRERLTMLDREPETTTPAQPAEEAH